jgi:hypothetical protein
VLFLLKDELPMLTVSYCYALVTMGSGGIDRNTLSHQPGDIFPKERDCSFSLFLILLRRSQLDKMQK